MAKKQGPTVAAESVATVEPTKPGGLEIVQDETWNTDWGIHRRLLEARKRLRKTKLWETFKVQREFESFSIHKVAPEIEAVLNDLGVITTFAVTKWSKGGNITIVEGVLSFCCVDQDGESFDVPTVGEGADNGDKGFGKAISYARKNGLIAAFNLGVGIDNESEDVKAQPAPEPTFHGAPQQTAPPQPSQAPPQYKSAAEAAGFSLSYVCFDEPKVEHVLPADILVRVTEHVAVLQNIAAVDAFERANIPTFEALWRLDQQKGFVVKRIIEGRRQALAEAIAKARAA